MLTPPLSSHKRSKSALALSLLHRDKTKSEAGEDDRSATGSDADSDTASPATSTSQHRTFGGLRSSRHKQQATNTASSDPPTTQPSSASMMAPSRSMVAPSQNGSLNSQDAGETIEQSVRKFKVFEILRTGDEAAIVQAVKETSGMPVTSEHEGQAAAGTKPLGTLEGTTLLHLAIQCADPLVVEQILSVAKSTPGTSLDINARDREGNTPLHLASILGRPTIVRLLLQQKDINDALVNYEGRSPSDLARTPEISQQLQLFRSLYVDSKTKEVQELVSGRSYDELEKLLVDPRVERVLDVNGGELATEPNTIQAGGTLLHEAARNKDLRLIQLLLIHGADPFRRDRKGKLPQDVTKDDKTRNILKRSPAAVAAQRGIQEKAVLGTGPSPGGESTPGGKEAREMKGYLKKWTNYTSGYKLRWFVLEDGVLSYYKHQDDAGSACRGAINMKITTLHMDPQDKTRFEIQGKSSVKYHLKANHAVEAKRWFWALNNAIQWTKDEAKEQQRRQKQRNAEEIRKGKLGDGNSSIDGKFSGKSLTPATAIGIPLSTTSSRVSFQDFTTGPPSIIGDDEGSIKSHEGSVTANVATQSTKEMQTTPSPSHLDDEEEYGDDASSREVQPASKDAFNITAQSASLQLSLLAQVSAALQAESSKGSTTPISDPTVAQAISTYESAVRSLRGLVGDLLKISQDRDAYWQYRLEREADARRMWEDSMAQVAKEQEALESRIGESEDKRKRTKKALREALESTSLPPSRSGSQRALEDHAGMEDVATRLRANKDGPTPSRRKSIGIRVPGRRKSTITDLTNLSDSDSEEDEEFFDAVDAGEVEITEMPPALPSLPPVSKKEYEKPIQDLREAKKVEISPSFKGYEDPVRQSLKLDPNNRPPRSLWVLLCIHIPRFSHANIEQNTLKNMIGKDMTKMALPVALNEPTSLLQRVTEDMEYTELLDTAADRTDSTERMLYVAAFAASEYASTIGRIAKPFNPLLGETYEYVRPDKGYRFIVEQVSHHPPIGAAWAESAKWEYFVRSLFSLLLFPPLPPLTTRLIPS